MTIGIAVVGLGMAHKPHIQSLRDLSGRVRIVACHAPSAARREAFGQAHPDLPLAADLDAVLAESRRLLDEEPRSAAELGALLGERTLELWSDETIGKFRAESMVFAGQLKRWAALMLEQDIPRGRIARPKE